MTMSRSRTRPIQTTLVAWASVSSFALAACARNAVPPAAEPAGRGLTIRLTSVPASTPAGAVIYVAGSFNNWDPAAEGFRLTRQGGQHAIALSDSWRTSPPMAISSAPAGRSNSLPLTRKS